MSQAPDKINLHKKSGQLELYWGDSVYQLSAEFLRVHSPSAEVQGHGPGQKKTPINKESVRIVGIEAQGNYAIKLVFDDGHDSGIYTWPYLLELASNKESLWNTYLEEAEQEKRKQEGIQPLKWQ